MAYDSHDACSCVCVHEDAHVFVSVVVVQNRGWHVQLQLRFLGELRDLKE